MQNLYKDWAKSLDVYKCSDVLYIQKTEKNINYLKLMLYLVSTRVVSFNKHPIKH